MTRAWDEVAISGYCLSECRFFYGLRGLVATVDRKCDQLKVWPHAEGIGDGKLWFRLSWARITLVDRWLP